MTPEEQKQTSIWGFGIAIAVTIAVIAISAWSHSQRVALVDTFTATSDGIVTQVESHRKKSGKRWVDEYTYFVSFADSDKVEHSGESLAKTKRRQIHKEGDEVRVRYDPMRADEACLIEGDESHI